MYLKKHSLTLLTTTATTSTFTTTGEFEQPLYAVRYIRGSAPIGSATKIKVKTAGSSWQLLDVAASTASWYRGPRTSVIVSTSGEVHEALVQYPCYGQKLTVVLSATTASGKNGTVELWEGSA